MKEQDEEFMENTWLVKSQIKKLQLRKMVEVQKIIERKWTETLFNYKQQKEALSSQVEALTKEKKDKENVLIDLDLINLKSVYLFNFKEIKRITLEAKIEKWVETNKDHQRNL